MSERSIQVAFHKFPYRRKDRVFFVRCRRTYILIKSFLNMKKKNRKFRLCLNKNHVFFLHCMLYLFPTKVVQIISQTIYMET